MISSLYSGVGCLSLSPSGAVIYFQVTLTVGSLNFSVHCGSHTDTSACAGSNICAQCCYSSSNCFIYNLSRTSMTYFCIILIASCSSGSLKLQHVWFNRGISTNTQELVWGNTNSMLSIYINNQCKISCNDWYSISVIITIFGRSTQ